MIKISKQSVAKVSRNFVIVILVLIIALFSTFTFLMGLEIGSKQSKIESEKEKAAEEKLKEDEALGKGITLGEDKLKEISSIIENIKVAKDLSYFGNLLVGSELEVKLGDIGPYTIFVYDNPTYDTLSEGRRTLFSDPLNNRGSIDDFLLNHIIFGEVNGNALVSGSEFKASNGKTLKVKRDGNEIFINGQRIKTRDIKSRNGIIHILEKPLPI